MTSMALKRSVGAVIGAVIAVCAGLAGCATAQREAATQVPRVQSPPATEVAAAEPTAEEQAPEAVAGPAEASAEPVPAPTKVPEKVGILTKRVRLLSDGSVERTTSFLLDSSGLVMREESRDAAGELTESVTYTYAAGRLVEKATLDGAGKTTSTRRYTYRATNLETEVLLNGKGVEQSRSVYAYDADGRLQSWTIYDGTGALLGTVAYRYASGRLSEAESQGPGGGIEGYTVYGYDEEGRSTVEKSLSSSRKVERSVERTFLGKALVEERYLAASGSVERKVAYIVDELGNPVTMTTLDSKGRVISTQTFEYRYVERS